MARLCTTRLAALTVYLGVIATPAAAEIPELFNTISAGRSFTCGITTDSQVLCWGHNDQGQASPPEGNFTQVAAGLGTHACALDATGDETCWGSGAAVDNSPPTGERFLQLDSGEDYSCGLLPGPIGVLPGWWVRCWGSAIGCATCVPAGVVFTAIDSGRKHSCGITDTATVECWGANTSGETQPPAGTFTQVSAGERLSCGLRSDATAQCWGLNSSGQTSVPPGTYLELSAGESFACALRTDGTLICWGDNSFGQTDAPTGNFVSLSAGWRHACALAADATVSCWGHPTGGTPPVCGNGSVEGREICDDGNNNSGDYCSPDCQTVTGSCGDGIFHPTEEQCDDGAANSDSLADACRNDCSLPSCGDGVTDSAEICDDGNNASGDDCSADCQQATGPCGDGTVQTSEKCDDGAANSDALPDACRTDCSLPSCGDGVTDSVEVCDDGGNVDGDYCSSDCQVAFSCGDAITQPLEEQCDDGAANSDTLPDACRSDCSLPVCGDGVTDPNFGEDCDGAGESATCDADCTSSLCGDGTHNSSAGEECDDGNATEGDACTSLCTVVRCQFDAPRRARRVSSGMVRVFEPCLAPDTVTAGGFPACGSPLASAAYTFHERKGKCSIKTSQKLEAPCSTGTGIDCSNLTIKAKCSGIIDLDGVSLITSGPWALNTVIRTTINDGTGGDMTIIDFPAQFAFSPPHKGSIKLKQDTNTLLNSLFDPGSEFPGCTTIEFRKLAIVAPNSRPFAILGVSSSVKSIACDIDRAKKGKPLSAEFVRAYESCPGLTRPSPNVPTSEGIPACALPTPLSQFTFGPLAFCRLSVTPATSSLCADGSGQPCFNPTFKLTCKDLRDAGGSEIDATDGVGTGAGWQLSLLTRITTEDPSAGLVTATDTPIVLDLPDGRRGGLKSRMRLSDVMRLAPCSNVELMSASLLDPDGHEFAVMGTGLR